MPVICSSSNVSGVPISQIVHPQTHFILSWLTGFRLRDWRDRSPLVQHVQRVSSRPRKESGTSLSQSPLAAFFTRCTVWVG